MLAPAMMLCGYFFVGVAQGVRARRRCACSFSRAASFWLWARERASVAALMRVGARSGVGVVGREVGGWGDSTRRDGRRKGGREGGKGVGMGGRLDATSGEREDETWKRTARMPRTPPLTLALRCPHPFLSVSTEDEAGGLHCGTRGLGRSSGGSAGRWTTCTSTNACYLLIDPMKVAKNQGAFLLPHRPPAS